MRLICLFLFMLVASDMASAETTGDLSRQQINAIGQLISGYSGGVVCNKKPNMEVAIKFLKSSIAESLTIDQLAKILVMPIPIHLSEMRTLSEGKLPLAKAIPEHCELVDKLFGPNGSVIQGLLK